MEKETLEEAAEKYAENKSSAEVFQEAHIIDFKSGAKWQSERMYSEEDMIAFSEFVSLNFPNQDKFLRKSKRLQDTKGYYTTKELLEKFIKK